MTRFWSFFIDKGAFTTLLGVALVAAGLLSVAMIPKESAPEVQIPVGVVTTVLPGASAEDTELLVTDVIEDRVLSLERVDTVTSVSGDGVSSVTVEFDASADIERSLQLLRDEVDAASAELPDEAEDPSVTDVNFSDQPILIVSIAGELAPAELTALGQTLESELERLPGVSEVQLSGVRDREVQVIIDQARLRQFGLSAGDVTRALSASGLAAPAGSLTIDDVRYSVRLESGLTSTSQVEAVAIPGPGGIPVRVGDVADVIDGLSDASRFSRVSVEGAPSSPALTLSVFKTRGGNILATGDAVKERLAALEETALAGTSAVISYDAAEDVARDLRELTKVGLETVVLVLVILFLTLGWRESLVAAASIPLSFLVAFIGLYASGNTINFISLFSLILAIGILVDSGIVVVEAMHTRLTKGDGKREAALGAVQEYSLPLIAGTLTTVAVFVPLFFLSGITGKFIASIPFTVIFVLLASIFVALGLVPLLATVAVRGESSRLQRRQEEWNERARGWYERYLRALLADRSRQDRFLIAMVGLFVGALTLPAIGLVRAEFFPTEDGSLLYVEIERPQGTALEETDLSVRAVEEVLYADERIESFVTEVGAGSAFGGGGGAGSNIANITVNLKEEVSGEVLPDLRRSLGAATAAVVTVTEPAGGPPAGGAIAVTYSGDDLAALTQAANEGARVLEGIPGTANVSTSVRDDGAEFVVRVDPLRAAQFGVSPVAVAEALRSALFGASATDIRAGGQDIEVRTRLALNPAYRDASEAAEASIDAVRELEVAGSAGPVPLSLVATIAYEPANATIRHEDGRRIATLSSDATASGNPLAIAAAFEEAMGDVDLPAGVEMRIGGESEEVNRSFAEMGIALLAGAALMLAILVLEFNSFRQSLYLLLLIPLSLIGVLFGLGITGSPLSFPAMLGVIALAGVIINHAIILMDSIARIGREREGQGASLADVVIEASATRFRPIILTTVVTVAGMVPLSRVSALWGPLAFSIMFGLTFSLLLTLVLVPILYSRWPGKAVRARYARKEGPALMLASGREG